MNGRKTQFRFSLLAVYLTMLLALFGTAQFSFSWFGTRWNIAVMVALALIFLTTMFIEIRRGFRLIGLVLASAVLGFLLPQWLPEDWHLLGGYALVAAGLIISLLAYIASRFSVPPGIELWLFKIAWAYSVGWLVLWLFPHDRMWRTILAGLGIPLLSGLVLAGGANIHNKEINPDLVRAAGQLLLISINMALCALVLLA